MTTPFAEIPIREHQFSEANKSIIDNPFALVVWNDNINTFDWVIESLVDICGHSPEQAEQCALLIHHKGKYAVKTGLHENLSPLREAISDRKIGATIEKNN